MISRILYYSTSTAVHIHEFILTRDNNPKLWFSTTSCLIKTKLALVHHFVTIIALCCLKAYLRIRRFHFVVLVIGMKACPIIARFTVQIYTFKSKATTSTTHDTMFLAYTKIFFSLIMLVPFSFQ